MYMYVLGEQIKVDISGEYSTAALKLILHKAMRRDECELCSRHMMVPALVGKFPGVSPSPTLYFTDCAASHHFVGLCADH